MPIAENLTVRALRMKGVPEADIVAATGNPELQRLIVRNYGSRPARPSRNEKLEQSFLTTMRGVIEDFCRQMNQPRKTSAPSAEAPHRMCVSRPAPMALSATGA
jgi:hypothetical protein